MANQNVVSMKALLEAGVHLYPHVFSNYYDGLYKFLLQT